MGVSNSEHYGFFKWKACLVKMQLLGLLQKMMSKLTFIQRILRKPPCPAKKKSSLLHNPTPPHHPKALTFFLTWDESTISETSTLWLLEKVEGTSFCVEAWKLLQILWHVLRKANWVEYIHIHLFFLVIFPFSLFFPKRYCTHWQTELHNTETVKHMTKEDWRGRGA